LSQTAKLSGGMTNGHSVVNRPHRFVGVAGQDVPVSSRLWNNSLPPLMEDMLGAERP